MTIFKNLMSPQGHSTDPHMDDDYGQKYGRRDESEAYAPVAPSAAPGARTTTAARATPTKKIEITYLDVYYTQHASAP